MTVVASRTPESLPQHLVEFAVPHCHAPPGRAPKAQVDIQELVAALVEEPLPRDLATTLTYPGTECGRIERAGVAATAPSGNPMPRQRWSAMPTARAIWDYQPGRVRYPAPASCPGCSSSTTARQFTVEVGTRRTSAGYVSRVCWIVGSVPLHEAGWCWFGGRAVAYG